MTSHSKLVCQPPANQDFPQHESAKGRGRKSVQKLQIMKFGGTSLADADCIARVVEIVRAATREGLVVVVVSAMSGVTNKLIEAATRSAAGDSAAAEAILDNLRRHHEDAIAALIHSRSVRGHLKNRMRELFAETGRLCKGTALIRELTPRASDYISSLGERLSASLVAAALAQRSVSSQAVEATGLVITDSHHGAAEPKMGLTTERCRSALRPLLQQGCVPVVTGFIGATEEGVLTTLGRGGSDYSATILAAALQADAVIIWKEVDGLLTADPRLVPAACTIPEISYREATELAYFGAKVLHPKTLCAVMQCGIPLWIRNTFAPDRLGTRITSTGNNNGTPVRALSAISDVALITIGGPGIAGVPHALERTLAAMKAIRADILLIAQSSAQNNICLVVATAIASRAVESLRSEFAHHLAGQQTEHIVVESAVAMVSVVVQNMRGAPGVVGRIFGALGRANVSIIALAQSSSESSICFLIAQKELQVALVAAHRELQLSLEDHAVRAPVREFASAASSNADASSLSLALSVNV